MKRFSLKFMHLVHFWLGTSPLELGNKPGINNGLGKFRTYDTCSHREYLCIIALPESLCRKHIMADSCIYTFHFIGYHGHTQTGPAYQDTPLKRTILNPACQIIDDDCWAEIPGWIPASITDTIKKVKNWVL